MLVGRFLLHLQSVSQDTARGGMSGSLPTQNDHWNSLSFARVVGSIGARIGSEDYYVAEVDENEGVSDDLTFISQEPRITLQSAVSWASEPHFS